MTKTLFVYAALWSALAVFAVFGRSSQATHVTVDELELKAKADETTVVAAATLSRPADGDDRKANLKFVLAIQRSTMWTDIKRRTVKISTSPRLTALLDADPDSLSDADLALLKKACHDGLKCVAVDQLLVLRSATRTLPNGLVAVRQVITKITHVLTNYTTEYYEDTYQYEELSDSETDPSKLDETVTVIVEDNKELCGIRVGDDVALMEDETVSATVTRDTQNVVKGTVTVPLGGSDDAAAKKTAPAAKKTAPAAAKKTAPAPAAKKTAPAAKAARSAPVLISLVGSDGEKDDDDDEDDDDDDDDEDDSADKSRAGVRVPSRNRDHGALLDRGSRASGQAYRADDTARPEAAAEVVVDDGGDDAGDSLTKADVVSAGDNNATGVKKGYVEDGVMNNGDMNLYNINTGTINKGIVNRSGADGGIVSVGVLNNGPANYGVVNNLDNSGTVANMSDTEIRDYVSSINQMYSGIIDNFSRQ